VIDYVIFKKDMYCDDALHFKAGKKYEIIGEAEGKYAVSYGRKNEMECCLVPKDYDGVEVFD